MDKKQLSRLISVFSLLLFSLLAIATCQAGVDDGDITEEPAEQIEEQESAPFSGEFEVIVDVAPLREGPGPQFARSEALAQGDRFSADRRTTDGEWYRMEGTELWISAIFVEEASLETAVPTATTVLPTTETPTPVETTIATSTSPPTPTLAPADTPTVSPTVPPTAELEDRDRDGWADIYDNCPDQAAVAGNADSSRPGCPQPPPTNTPLPTQPPPTPVPITPPTSTPTPFAYPP